MINKKIEYYSSVGEAKIGYYLFVWSILFYYLRFQELIPPLKIIRISGVLLHLYVLWFLVNIKKDIFRHKELNLLLIFTLLCGLSGTWANNATAFRTGFVWLTNYYPLACGFVLLISTRERFEAQIAVWCCICCGISLIIVKNGGTGPGSFLYDENDVALGLGMCMPLAFYYSLWPGQSWKAKWFGRASFVLGCMGIVASFSRGGLLGLFSVVGTMWLLSHSKIKIAAWGLAGVIFLGGTLIGFLPEGYIEDFSSGMTNTEDDTRKERFNSWEIAWVMFLDNPIFGVGTANFPWTAHEYQQQTSWWYIGAKSLAGRQVHSMYFEMLADMGIVGVSLYYFIIFSLLNKMRKIQKEVLRNMEKYSEFAIKTAFTARALIVSMACFLVSGAFISVSYYPHLPIWTGLCLMTIICFEKNKDKKESLTRPVLEESKMTEPVSEAESFRNH